MTDQPAPTLAEARAAREVADRTYAHARRLIASDHTKSAETVVEAAMEHEARADKMELAALRAIITRDPAEATIAKLQQIADDAHKRAEDKGVAGIQGDNRPVYWAGFRDGILRAITTVEGRDNSPS